MDDASSALLTLNPYEARTAAAVFERIFPVDENGPGAEEIGVVAYVDRALSGPYRDLTESYRLGLAALDRAAQRRFDNFFADCKAEEQDVLIADLERGVLPDFLVPEQREFFWMLREHTRQGLFSDPAHGGNMNKLGWKVLGHPGVWLEHSAEENLAAEPVMKGEIRSLRDAGFSLGDATEPVTVPGYDPQKGAEPPSGPADVVLVGVGAVGALVAPMLAHAGLKVIGLEAGPYRTKQDFVPDELTSSYYARGSMGAKFLSETPRWRLKEGEPTREATFTLGRMMNGVGGSVIHWGGALRRCHPHHFEYLTHVRENFGEKVLPEGNTLVDWPITYEELEPYYTAVEYLAGVAGDGEANPFIPRSRPYPMPPMRPFRTGEIFRKATEAMGLHPYPTPVAANSVPHNGFPANTYTPWSGAGFGPFCDDRWYPALTSVPEAMATGNFDLKTHCRVVRVLTDSGGHARGVEYVDAAGELRIQEARTVILCSYTFENVRLMFLSQTERHPGGLGNGNGQLGKHFMTKMWADVFGFFPDTVFNGHTGPAAQMWSLDDFIAADFDAPSHGFVGGATPNVENQRLPLGVTREALPQDVPAWGKGYKDHVRSWQNWAAVRLQPDALPYEGNFLDLDPRYRDTSGLGLPLVRITYDMQENEHMLSDFMEGKAEEILREMGAAKTWRGPRFGGVVSSHDLGGCRMGEDPAASVVDPGLQVHDTPGLYVFGGAVFSTCPGVNPTLTMWALCSRAAEGLIGRLREGLER